VFSCRQWLNSHLHHGIFVALQTYFHSTSGHALWPRENGMEVAAFVMLGSVALWFAQEFSDNQL
jgi:hypothetical protein